MLLEHWRHITDGLTLVLVGLELGHKKTLQSVSGTWKCYEGEIFPVNELRIGYFPFKSYLCVFSSNFLPRTQEMPSTVTTTFFRVPRLVPYILESNPHPFYSFRGLKYQMRIRIACLSRSRAEFWKNDTATVIAVRTSQQFIIYNII